MAARAPCVALAACAAWLCVGVADAQLPFTALPCDPVPIVGDAEVTGSYVVGKMNDEDFLEVTVVMQRKKGVADEWVAIAFSEPTSRNMKELFAVGCSTGSEVITSFMPTEGFQAPAVDTNAGAVSMSYEKTASTLTCKFLRKIVAPFDPPNNFDVEFSLAFAKGPGTTPGAMRQHSSKGREMHTIKRCTQTPKIVTFTSCGGIVTTIVEADPAQHVSVVADPGTVDGEPAVQFIVTVVKTFADRWGAIGYRPAVASSMKKMQDLEIMACDTASADGYAFEKMTANVGTPTLDTAATVNGGYSMQGPVATCKLTRKMGGALQFNTELTFGHASGAGTVKSQFQMHTSAQISTATLLDCNATLAPPTDAPVDTPAPGTTPAPDTTPTPDKDTPEPANSTPAPGSNDTPAPGTNDTPEPGVVDTPAPVAKDTPAPVNNDTPMPAGTTPAPGSNDTPSPNGGTTPSPDVNTPAPVVKTATPGSMDTPAPANTPAPASGPKDTPSPGSNPTPSPVADTPAPVADTPAPQNIDTPAPVNTPAPVDTPVPQPGGRDTPTPPVIDTPEPVADTPEPANSTPAPGSNPTPSPDDTTPAPPGTNDTPAPGSGTTPNDTPVPGSGTTPSPDATPAPGGNNTTPSPGATSAPGGSNDTPAPNGGTPAPGTANSTAAPASQGTPVPGSNETLAPGAGGSDTAVPLPPGETAVPAAAGTPVPATPLPPGATAAPTSAPLPSWGTASPANPGPRPGNEAPAPVGSTFAPAASGRPLTFKACATNTGLSARRLVGMDGNVRITVQEGTVGADTATALLLTMEMRGYEGFDKDWWAGLGIRPSGGTAMIEMESIVADTVTNNILYTQKATKNGEPQRGSGSPYLSWKIQNGVLSFEAVRMMRQDGMHDLSKGQWDITFARGAGRMFSTWVKHEISGVVKTGWQAKKCNVDPLAAGALENDDSGDGLSFLTWLLIVVVGLFALAIVCLGLVYCCTAGRRNKDHELSYGMFDQQLAQSNLGQAMDERIELAQLVHTRRLSPRVDNLDSPMESPTKV